MQGRSSIENQAIHVAMGGRTGWKTVLVLLLIAAIGLAVGAAMQREVGRQPSLDDPQATVDLATLGSAEPPTGHVMLTNAAIDQDRALVKTTKSRTGRRYTSWAPILPAADADRSAPVRFFHQRDKYMESELAVMPVFGGRYEGVLVRNGMPEEAVANLRANGIAVASPHFVLDESGDLPSEWHQWVAIAGFCVGGIFLFVALIAAIQMTRGRPMRL